MTRVVGPTAGQVLVLHRVPNTIVAQHLRLLDLYISCTGYVAKILKL